MKRELRIVINADSGAASSVTHGTWCVTNEANITKVPVDSTATDREQAQGEHSSNKQRTWQKLGRIFVEVITQTTVAPIVKTALASNDGSALCK